MRAKAVKATRRPDLDAVERATSGVEGWFGPYEGRLLYDLAAAADPRGCIVEVGSWHGRSTIWLAAGAKSGRGALVVAIDPHAGTHLRPDGETTEATFRANLERAGVADQVEVVVAPAERVVGEWTRPVSLLWIDGDHDYRSVRRDLELWEPFVLPDAYVALHDTFVISGPERVVQELLIRTGSYRSFMHAETTTAARRGAPTSVEEALARRVSLLRRRLYGVRLRGYEQNRFRYATLRDLLSR